MALFKKNDIVKGSVSVGVNIAKNNFLDKKIVELEKALLKETDKDKKKKIETQLKKERQTRMMINVGVFLLGDKLFKNKNLSSEYLRFNSLEKVLKDFAENSKNETIQKQASFINADEESLFIQAYEQGEIEADEEELYINSEEEEEKYINAGDNILIED